MAGMLPLQCPPLAVPREVMQHIVHVESSFNPYAIGVVGGHLLRQPANLGEAVATADMLAQRGYNFSLGLAQVNRYNLARYGLDSYREAFQACPNLQAGARILAECYARSGKDWGRSFSCYYSGNFETGYRDGYVQKVFASMGSKVATNARPIPVLDARHRAYGAAAATGRGLPTWVAARIELPTPSAAVPAGAGGAAAPSPAMPAPAAETVIALQPGGAPPRPIRASPSTTATATSIVDAAFVF